MDKKTKIVATIGPASDRKEILRELARAGMNVARINFSHGSHESNGKAIDMIWELGRELKMPIAVMADLQGPRIRIAVDEDVKIKAGGHIVIGDTSLPPNFQFSISNFQTISNDKNLKLIKLDWDGIVDNIEKDNNILIEDGIISIKIVEKAGNLLLGKASNKGIIKNHKGVNIPDAKLAIPILTEKDEKDLKFVLEKEVDFVALSFVSNGGEINEVREKIKKMLQKDRDLPQIVSKIERKEAIKNIDEIISASDAVMVARGDLGIELPEAKVIIYQKEIIEKCLKKAKPVIVATQMMNSMIENPIPTRAEVSDVSNAVIDHADAVMLSGESANGKFPVKTVETMSEIIRDTEESRFDDFVPLHADVSENMSSDYAGIVASAWKMAKTSEAKAIAVVSLSGFTARMVSNYRPERPILVATNNLKTYNQLSLVWGAEPYLFSEEEKVEDYLELMLEKARKEKKLKKGDKVVMILGRPKGGKKYEAGGHKRIGIEKKS